ncbi:MAG: hypothetical protein IJE41_00995 [Clostridia bacterium]|nr:hypothetical protein [Clostridia bacterium]MBQ6937719.1 hypothetical protein [Clostridia bacterium]
MEFFDKVKKVAADVAVASGKQGKKLYDVTKIKLEIAEKQNNVKALYKEIGFDAYKAYKANTDVVEYIKEKLMAIDAIEEEIAVLRKKADDIKNTQEVGVEDIAYADEDAQDAEVFDAQQEYDEAETEPIEPIE